MLAEYVPFTRKKPSSQETTHRTSASLSRTNTPVTLQEIAELTFSLFQYLQRRKQGRGMGLPGTEAATAKELGSVPVCSLALDVRAEPWSPGHGGGRLKG